MPSDDLHERAEEARREAHEAIDSWAGHRNRYVDPELRQHVTAAIDRALDLRALEQAEKMITLLHEFEQRQMRPLRPLDGTQASFIEAIRQCGVIAYEERDRLRRKVSGEA